MPVSQQIIRHKPLSLSHSAFSTEPATLGESSLDSGSMASVSLPPSLFQTIDDDVGDSIGIFFALYSAPTLFPLRVSLLEEAEAANSTFRTVVSSPVVAATVGPGQEFNNLVMPVEIDLRINASVSPS